MLVAAGAGYALLCEVIAGFSGGAAKTLAFYPLDTLTTWRETRHTGRSSELYRGCLLTVAGAAPYAAIFHTAFWASRQALAGLPLAAREGLSGSCGALTAAVVWVPFECIKHRVQVAAPGCSTPRAALRTTLEREGVRGLYAGMLPTLVRNVPYNALHFGLFAALRRLCRALGLPGASAWAGAFAGALTALATTPIDLINTRVQVQGAMAGAPRYSGIADAVARIVREEGGVGALFRGALPRVLQYAPSAMLFFAVFEGVKRRLLALAMM